MKAGRVPERFRHLSGTQQSPIQGLGYPVRVNKIGTPATSTLFLPPKVGELSLVAGRAGRRATTEDVIDQVDSISYRNTTATVSVSRVQRIWRRTSTENVVDQIDSISNRYASTAVSIAAEIWHIGNGYRNRLIIGQITVAGCKDYTTMLSHLPDSRCPAKGGGIRLQVAVKAVVEIACSCREIRHGEIG